nr:RNA-directed DNA polymerase, eukaryota [Tanacetum cinerariifolium]
MGIFNEHQLKFNSIKDAKKLLEAVEKRFGGNAAINKTQRNILKQQYENFTAPSSEMLDQTFDMLQKLVRQLKLLEEKLSQEDVNQKLLRSLSPEWNTHVFVWRNKAYLDTMSMDDLYNNLKSTNSPQLVHKDLEQIHPDDMEEMDLRWKMAMLTMRARRFLKKTRRKLTVNGNETIGFEKSNVECYNCHKRGHFAKECKAPRNQDNKNKKSLRKNVHVETSTFKPLVSCDGLCGYDWSDQAEEWPNYELMAFASSSSDSEVSNDSNCSKSCLETDKLLKSQNDQLLKDLKKFELMVLGYKMGLESVEERLEFYKINESIYLEYIKVLKVKIQIGEIAIRELKKKLEIAQKEKDSIQLNVDKFEHASKSLNKLIECQIVNNCKKGLGYKNYNAVSPPYTGNFMPPTPNLSFTGLDEFVNKPVFENCKAKSSEAEPKVVRKNDDALIIKEWVLDNEEEDVSQPKIEKKIVRPSIAKIEFVKSKQQKKSARKTVKQFEQHRQNTHNGKEIVITESSVKRDLQLADEKGSAMPTDPHHTPAILQPSSQPQMIQKPKKPKRKDTQVPQPSDPTESVADEAIHKELSDSLTQSMAIPNESGSQGTDLGGGPRCQKTMGDTIAQTRVLDLEKTITTQRNEIDSLKRRVKKLEKRNRSRTHKLKTLYKVGLSARVESFGNEESLGEDASKQGKRIDAIDADEDITLVNDADNERFDVDVLGGEEMFIAGKNKNVVEEVVDHIAVKRVEEKRNKPPTKAQQRKIMCTYLKNMEGYKLKDLKLKEFDSIQEMFDKAFKRVNTFEDFRTELVEGKEKRAGIELEQEITKKQKVEDDKVKSIQIYMLVEKKYPLTPPTLSMMLAKKLQIDYESEMPYQLCKLIKKQLQKLGVVTFGLGRSGGRGRRGCVTADGHGCRSKAVRIRVTFLSLITSDRNFHNSYENQTQKISKSVFVINFPEDSTACDLWKVCSDYGTVVDVFIPFKRSKSGKRFAFVRFIKVIHLERLVSILCTIWIGRYHLHANYVRFERPQKPNSSIPRGPNHSTHKETNMENSKKSFVFVLKRGSQSHVTPEITKPALVLDETCIKEFDFGMSLMGMAKDVFAIPNLPCIISKEEKFLNHSDIGSWFTELIQATNSFENDERIVWISIEGLPIKAWTPNTFRKIASLWGEQKVIIQGKVYWIRVKELDTWFTNFQEDDQDDLSSDGESQECYVANKADNNESDVDRVSKSSFMHENDTTHKDVNSCKKGGDEPKFPPGFTPDNNDQEKKVEENIKDATKRVQSLSNKLNDHCSNRGFSSQRKKVSTCDYFVALMGTWVLTSSKLLNIFVYAPQELNERRDLWDYFRTFIDRWEGDTVIMGDFNEVRSEHERLCFYMAHKSASKMSKLDHYLISKGVLDLFPHPYGLCLDRHLSDHRPILLRETNYAYGPSPFWFFHSWFAMEGFNSFVETTWKSLNIFEPKINIQQNLSEVDKLIDQGKSNDEILIKRIMLLNDLQELNNRNAMEISQKVKIQWSIEGDENSKYFHDLERTVTYEEIKRAVWDCGTNKSPRPNEFSFEFYPLIPKIQDAKFVKEFRPISLIGSVYKIIEKILANRLCVVLPYLISDVQSTFVANRQIIDGPFILNELLSWCKFKRLNGMIFKVDFEKAFDYVKWTYLDETLKAFGFGSKWRNWISSCLNNAMGSVLINGSPTLDFQLHKGLKQGDLISLFLIILIIETLHITFKRVLNAGLYKGISLNDSFTIFHLFYANEVVFIGEWNNNNIQTLLSVLSSNIVAVAASLIGCSILTALFNYLGVKVGSNMSRITSWDDVISKWVWRFLIDGLSLWTRFIKAIFGNKETLDTHKLILRRSPWQDVILAIHSLQSKEEVALKVLYKRLYALEMCKSISVAEKMGYPSLSHSFRRMSRGVVEQENYGLLCSKVANLVLPNISDRQFIAIACTWIPSNSNLLIISVYAPQPRVEKRLLWNYISSLITHWQGDALVLGDFNEVRNAEERRGSVFNLFGAADFNEFISSSGLIMLEGYSFTWSHPSACKMSKLDRFLVTEGFLSVFPHCSAISLDRHLSDHWPILLRELQVDYGATPFRFYHSWLNISGFDLMKAKIKWAVEGDENSKFFHGIINRKHANLAIKDLLEEPISSDEIRIAVSACGENKSPGQMVLLLNFLEDFGTLLVPDPKGVNDYRPLSLIGSLYKVVTKILALRLSSVLDYLISEVQSAFLPNRQILDGPFIINDVLSWCKLKRHQAMIFKVDFAKAYDSVRWYFLDDVLSSFGFGSKWRSWILGSLSSGKASVLVNGSPTSEFQFHCGLKQGDPLASYLFILIMESLHLSFARVVKAGFFKGVKISDSVTISHLFYADDAVFVGEWSNSNLSSIMNVLHCFSLAFGLKINVHKSQRLGVGVSFDIIEVAAYSLGCSVMKTPFKYLGFPVGGNMSSIKAWDDIIRKIKSRLSKWKVNTFSIGGRLTLLKSILGSTPSYWMSLFKVPKAVLATMEAMRRDFFMGLMLMNGKLRGLNGLKFSCPRKMVVLEFLVFTR